MSASECVNRARSGKVMSGHLNESTCSKNVGVDDVLCGHEGGDMDKCGAQAPDSFHVRPVCRERFPNERIRTWPYCTLALNAYKDSTCDMLLSQICVYVAWALNVRDTKPA